MPKTKKAETVREGIADPYLRLALLDACAGEERIELPKPTSKRARPPKLDRTLVRACLALDLPDALLLARDELWWDGGGHQSLVRPF